MDKLVLWTHPATLTNKRTPFFLLSALKRLQMDDITTLSGTFFFDKAKPIVTLYTTTTTITTLRFSLFIIESFPIVRYPRYTNSSALYATESGESIVYQRASIIAGLYSVSRAQFFFLVYNKDRTGFSFPISFSNTRARRSRDETWRAQG